MSRFFIIFGLIFTLIYSEDYETYLIKSGETLYQISKKYNISIEELCKINSLKKDSTIPAGKKIIIPKKNTKEQQTNFIYHIVEDNENLFRIGLKYNITVDKLCKINNINENTKLYKGMKIKIPEELYIKYINNTQNKNNNLQKKDEKLDNDSIITYVVKADDTLYSISRRFKVTIKEICQINNISETSPLITGTKLIIKTKINPENNNSNNQIQNNDKKDERRKDDVSIFQKNTNIKNQLTNDISNSSNNKKIYINNIDIPENERIVPYRKTIFFKGIMISGKDEVRSPIDGEVIVVEIKSSYGIVIIIKNEDTIVTIAGFSEVNIKKNDFVKTGSLIGKKGKLLNQNEDSIIMSIQYKNKIASFDMNQKKFFIEK